MYEPKENDPLMRPVIQENIEVTGTNYAYDIPEDFMKSIQIRDTEQQSLGRSPLNVLLPTVSDASRVGYYYNGHHIYFTLQSRHNTHESIQEVIDHVTMYVEGLDCRWITGE